MEKNPISEQFLRSCEELFEWMSNVHKETSASVRALVLIAAARLDTELENTLKSVLVRNPNGQDNLFDPDRPLGSFSAKISLCHRLGIIDDEFHSALQVVRKIRNDFAHSVVFMALSDSPHKERIVELERWASLHPLWPDAVSLMKPSRLSESSRSFGATMIVMTLTLLAFCASERPFQVQQPCRFRHGSS
jgi:DNA-binding MltR family transcriptional regulator